MKTTLIYLAVCAVLIFGGGGMCGGRTGPCRLATGINIYCEGDAHMDEGDSAGSATGIIYVQYHADNDPIDGRGVKLNVGQNMSSYKNDGWWYPDGEALFPGPYNNEPYWWGKGKDSKWSSSGQTGANGLVTMRGTRRFGNVNGIPFVSKISVSNPRIPSQSAKLYVSTAAPKDCRTTWPYTLVPWKEDGESWCKYHGCDHWFTGGWYFSGTSAFPTYTGGGAQTSSMITLGDPFVPPLLTYPFNTPWYVDPNENRDLFYWPSDQSFGLLGRTDDEVEYFMVDPNGIPAQPTGVNVMPMSMLSMVPIDPTFEQPHLPENEYWLLNNYPSPPWFGWKEVSTKLCWQDGDMGNSVITEVPEPFMVGNATDYLTVLLHSNPNTYHVAFSTASPKTFNSLEYRVRVWTDSWPQGRILPITQIDSSPDRKFHVAQTGEFLLLEVEEYVGWVDEFDVYNDWSVTDDPNEVMVDDPNFLMTQWDHDFEGWCKIDPQSDFYDPNYTECQFKQMFNEERWLSLPIVPMDVNDFVEMELIEVEPAILLTDFCGVWLSETDKNADLDENGIVNFIDYAKMVNDL